MLTERSIRLGSVRFGLSNSSGSFGSVDFAERYGFNFWFGSFGSVRFPFIVHCTAAAGVRCGGKSESFIYIVSVVIFTITIDKRNASVRSV